MQRVGEHLVPAGPLAPCWRAWTLGPQRAGTISTGRIAVENAGSATWRSHGAGGVQASYHWLDPLGNPIVWDGIRTPLPRPVAPGETLELELPLLAPRPPGRYRLAIDLVEEHRFWFSEIGCAMLEVELDVESRLTERRLAVRIRGGHDDATAAALAAQEEPIADGEAKAEAVAHLVAGAEPPPDWSRLVLDAHAEGWVAVGGAIVPERRDRTLAPWAPGTGRNPRFEHPLLLPSLLDGIEPSEHLELPAYDRGDGLFDGRIEIRFRQRSGRRRA